MVPEAATNAFAPIEVADMEPATRPSKNFRFRRIRASIFRVLVAAGNKEDVPIKPTVAFMAKLPAPQDPHLTEAALELDHCRAICAEIGERLQHCLAQDTSPKPTRLQKLINRIAEVEGNAPPFMPDCEDEPTARERTERGQRWFFWKRTAIRSHGTVPFEDIRLGVRKPHGERRRHKLPVLVAARA